MSIAGNLFARGGASGPYNNGGGGGLGRIRLETYSLTLSGGGGTAEAVQGFPQPLFPPAGQPSLAITSIGGLPVPAAPAGSVLAAPDVLLPTGTTNPVAVVLTASNIPLGTAIQVTATPQAGAKTSAISSGLSGTVASSTAAASISLNLSQTSVLTATATFPLVASAGGGPVYAQGLVPSLVAGDEVTHVRVAAVLGGPTQVTYITRTGREIAQQ